MNAGSTAALLIAAAVAAFTVWLCTAESEASPRHRRSNPATVSRFAVESRATPTRQAVPDHHTGTGGPGDVAHYHAQSQKARPAAPAMAPPASVRTPRNRPDQHPVLPLAFREFPAGMQFEPAQALAVEEVQDQFIAALGGETADPATPGYREKWLDTQRTADLRLRARIGAQAFAAWQRLRTMQEHAAVGHQNASAP